MEATKIHPLLLHPYFFSDNQLLLHLLEKEEIDRRIRLGHTLGCSDAGIAAVAHDAVSFHLADGGIVSAAHSAIALHLANGGIAAVANRAITVNPAHRGIAAVAHSAVVVNSADAGIAAVAHRSIAVNPADEGIVSVAKLLCIHAASKETEQQEENTFLSHFLLI